MVQRIREGLKNHAQGKIAGNMTLEPAAELVHQAQSVLVTASRRQHAAVP